ncbi:hypothetical protein [Bacillus solitudinis]|uniref:hypothetical protein n=1 Tax=Bacillus solitudinis TaxID=2014074 RepID=UPI000C248CD4|nr:hypothetical protein [Bacillus solitudinis]
MFDPTIFDNIKVVLEGMIYDFDLANEIIVTSREDSVDLATMSRKFAMQFQLQDYPHALPYAEVSLFSSIKDFSLEMLDHDEKTAGCVLEINFYSTVSNVDDDCHHIEKELSNIWNGRPFINQQISFNFRQKQKLMNKTNLNFKRKINEGQINDFKEIIDHCLESLEFYSENYSENE